MKTMTLTQYYEIENRLPQGFWGPIGGPLVISVSADDLEHRPRPRVVGARAETRRPVISANYEIRAMQEAGLRRIFEDAQLRARLSDRRVQTLPAGWAPARIG